MDTNTHSLLVATANLTLSCVACGLLVTIFRKVASTAVPKSKPKKPDIRPDERARFLDEVAQDAIGVADLMAEHNAKNGNKVTGRDKQREALRHAKLRCAAVNLEPDVAELASRIEAAVLRRKEPKP